MFCIVFGLGVTLIYRRILIFEISCCLFALGLGEMSRLSREPLYLKQIAPLQYLLSTSSKIDAFLLVCARGF
jgi:hypothetical protein